MMAGRAAKESGFSLIELVMVILVLGVAMVPLALQMSTTAQHAAGGHTASSAAFLAREKLEEILADRYAPGRGYAYIVTANYPAQNPVPGFPGFARSVAVSGDSTYSSVTYRTVSVTVTPPGLPAVTATTWVVN